MNWFRKSKDPSEAKASAREDLKKVIDQVSSESETFTEATIKALSAAASFMRIAPFGKPVFTDWNTTSAIRDGYKSSNWVYSAVRTLSDEASALPWVVQERSSSGEWQTIHNHPLERLMEFPNPFQTRQDIIERITQHLNLSGNALLHKVKLNNMTVELWVINPDSIKPIPDDKNFIKGYQFYRNGKEDGSLIDPANIIHLMFADPANPYWGMSPLQAIGKIVDAELDAIKWWKLSLQNRCVKDGILSFKRPLNTDAWNNAREQLQSQLVGSYNARGPIVVGEDVDYTPFSLTPAELDFVNSRKMTREDICFLPGTLVYTGRGVIPIEDIVPGDRVLTHTGKFRPVTNTMRRYVNEDVVRLQAKGLDSVTCTVNHPFMSVYSKPDRKHKCKVIGSPEWKEADELEFRGRGSSNFSRRGYDSLVVPNLETEMEFIDLSVTYDNDLIEENGYIKPHNPCGRSVFIPRYLKCDYSLGKLIGLYLAEGCTNDHQVLWYLGSHELDLVEFIRDTLHEKFNLDLTHQLWEEDSVYRLRVSNRILCQFFKQFGRIAHEKIIPEWIYAAPEEFRKGLIDGYVAGDGNETGAYRRICTTSLSLAHGVRMLIWSAGLHASFYTRHVSGQHSIKGRVVNKRTSYEIAWRPDRKVESSGFNIENYSAFFVNSKEYLNYQGYVYNLEVEEDESYVTTGGVAHNCSVFRVPPPLLGILGSAGYANIREARKILWVDTLLPYMESLRQTLTWGLVSDFGDPMNLRLWLDFSAIDVFVDIIADRAESAQRFHLMGVPFNTVNQVLNLGMNNVPTGNMSFLPINIMSYGSDPDRAQEVADLWLAQQVGQQENLPQPSNTQAPAK